MQTNRNYKNKDVDMLLAAATITDAAIANKVFLQSKRSTWADPFFENLRNQINSAIKDYLGVDNAKQLREATLIVLNLEATALPALAEIKVQIVEDFKSNKPRQQEILNQLGFTTYHKAAQQRDQEALINLLYQYKMNLTPALKTEIVTAGTATAALDAITAFAETLKEADITQEGAKSNRAAITSEAITAFNAVYDKVITISKIATKFYKNDPALQRQFTFAKVSKAINISKTTPPTN